MKKIYSLLVAGTAALAIQAQNATPYTLTGTSSVGSPIVVTPDFDFSKLGHDVMSDPEPGTTGHYVNAKRSAAKATEFAGGFILEDNQYIVGNSTSDEYWNFGSVPYEGETLIGATIFNTAYSKLKNAKALGIRFCLPEDWYDETGHLQVVDDIEVTKVTLHDNTIDGVIREATPRSVSKGWNYVRFKTPQELDPIGMLMSYTYVQTKSPTCFGMCNWPETAPGGFYTYLYNSDAGKWMWSNFSNQYGAVCIQLIVEADPLSDYDVAATAVNAKPAAAGVPGEAAVYFTSNSKKDVENFEYTITLGDKSETRTVTPNSPIVAGLNQQVAYYIATPAVDKYGSYKGSITVNKVNGETLDFPTSLSFTQDVYTRLAQRHSLVEEWTGTGCGNCPRGWAGMEYLKESHADKCYVIAVHQYNQNDPMYCNRYGGLGLAAAPACKIDRKTQADPYYGTDNTGIHNAVAYYSSIAPSVDVKVYGFYTDDKDKIDCSAEVEWLFDSDKYTIAYVLTADGLTGKGAWLQKNYYAGKTLDPNAIIAEIPEFAEFFSGGEKGKGATELVYNDVLIGSSWSSNGSNLAKALGTTKHKAGEKLTNEYTCSISASDVCKAAMDYDNLYVTAIVLDANNEVVNAARAKVTSAAGINSVLAPIPTTDGATYDLSGRRVESNGKGLYIVGGKKIIK